jgi:hypothetical protein
MADLQWLATTPATDPAALKRTQAAGRAGTLPPTPLTAVPPTPTFPTGPSPKRQKMMIDDSNVHEFEAEVYNATCPQLFLEPTKSFAESLALMEAFTHPNNQNPSPVRKTRKRTTAELAADEAEAQNLQSFMLAGDEQQASMATTATGGDEGAVRAVANSQNFARFKTLATIKANHEEADRRKKEEEARVAQVKRQAQMEAEAQKRRDMEANRQQAEAQERQQQRISRCCSRTSYSRTKRFEPPSRYPMRTRLRCRKLHSRRLNPSSLLSYGSRPPWLHLPPLRTLVGRCRILWAALRWQRQPRTTLLLALPGLFHPSLTTPWPAPQASSNL